MSFSLRREDEFAIFFLFFNSVFTDRRLLLNFKFEFVVSSYHASGARNHVDGTGNPASRTGGVRSQEIGVSQPSTAAFFWGVDGGGVGSGLNFIRLLRVVSNRMKLWLGRGSAKCSVLSSSPP